MNVSEKPVGAVAAAWMSLLLLPVAGPAEATTSSLQARSDTLPEPPPSQVRVFLDCPGHLCDTDHIRRQIEYVSWVRDRKAADVQVLVTRERTGGGGERLTFDFLGRNEFEEAERRLQYTSSPSEPEHETRSGIVRILEQGLVGFLAQTPTGEKLEVRYLGEKADQPSPRPAEDPWNRWVFETSLSTFLDGGGRRTRYNLNGSLSANRTTERWKTDLGLSAGYDRSEFLIPRDSDTTTVVATEENYSLRALTVSSLSSHWSAGGFGSVRHSTRRNQQVATSFGPAIEYNLFPYAESTRRQLTVLYALTGNVFEYQTPTIFDKRSEERLRQTLNVSFDVTEPWGEVRLSVEGRHFLDDIKQNRLTLSGNVRLQLVEGLSLRIFGRGSRIRDQIFLSREEVDPEEVFTGQREFAADFDYFTRIGLSYTFGSDLSEVVNVRFDGLGRGGGAIF